MSWSDLSKNERGELLAIARAAIERGLAGELLVVDPQSVSPPLRAPGASFVTLERHGELRGCIGSLTARQPLVCDVAHNAREAAFGDPRFAPLRQGELEQLDVHLSLLSAPEPIEFSSEAELLAHLRPGVDGLILEEGFRRGTFLPSVWEQLPQAQDFVRHLKRKAGLPVDYWSATLRVQRYTATPVP